MSEYKSLDYLQEIIRDNGKESTLDILQNIAYILCDNGYNEAEYFILDLMESEV